jgi:hypothetical protein
MLYFIIQRFTSVLRAGLRDGPAGHLPGAPTNKGP